MTTTTDRPIIFGAESIRAILDGRKTQTRRVVKPQPEPFLDTKTKMVWSYHHRAVYGTYAEMAEFMRLHSPYTVGQRLWVREKFALHPTATELGQPVVFYAARGDSLLPENHWRSPIYMPRWASRITLEVTGVRAERLQDITHNDICMEGWDPIWSRPFGNGTAGDDARAWYAALWNRINPQYPWDSNPWVWIMEFAVAGGDR